MKNTKLFNTLFFCILLLELLGEVLYENFDIPYLYIVLKPLLMPALAFWFYSQIDRINSFYKLLLFALFFAWLGDVFLMFLPINELFFLAGLGSFLITHLLYIAVFLKTDSTKPSIYKKRPHLILPFLLFGLSLILYLYREGNEKFIEMQIPVIVYASVIMLMILVAIGRYKKVNQNSFKWVLIGGLLFMFSDTLIALNNFTDLFNNSKYLARLGIMAMYGVGQYAIIHGCLKQHKEVN